MPTITIDDQTIMARRTRPSSPRRMFGAAMRRDLVKVLDLAPELIYSVKDHALQRKKIRDRTPRILNRGLDGMLSTNVVTAMFAERHVDHRQVRPAEVDAFSARASGGVAEAALRASDRRRSARLDQAQSTERLKAQPAVDVGVRIGTSRRIKGSRRGGSLCW